MHEYRCLKQQKFTNGEFTLLPIRMEDRFEIMRWRNEQIYHLRQKEPLTSEQQDLYFETVISKLFDQDQPNQILFSFFHHDKLVGYGGLVHINWVDKNAEISFLQNSNEHLKFWYPFLSLIKSVAFNNLNLNKIFTYAYDVRHTLFAALESNGFINEAIFSNQATNNNQNLDVLIHSCFNTNTEFWRRKATMADAKLLFDWINDPEVRKQSLNSNTVVWENHIHWLWAKIHEHKSDFYIYFVKDIPAGQIRLDFTDEFVIINYLVAPNMRGKGIGHKMIHDIVSSTNYNFDATVKESNLASNKIFYNNKFNLIEEKNGICKWQFIR